jgi:hypothetical protein
MARVMLKRFAVPVAALIATEAAGQSALLDLLAEETSFRLDWDAYGNDESRLSIEISLAGISDRFVANKPNLESFVMFLDGYIVFASGYGDLKNLYDREDGRTVAPPIPYIQKRLANIAARDVVTPDCGSTLTLETIACSLNALAESLDIQKSYVRYDEGRHEVAEDRWRSLDLNARGIALQLSRYAEQGLPLPDLRVTPGAPEYWEETYAPPSSFCCSERFREFMRERVVEQERTR